MIVDQAADRGRSSGDGLVLKFRAAEVASSNLLPLRSMNARFENIGQEGLLELMSQQHDSWPGRRPDRGCPSPESHIAFDDFTTGLSGDERAKVPRLIVRENGSWPLKSAIWVNDRKDLEHWFYRAYIRPRKRAS